jgi:hypothetical protein
MRILYVKYVGYDEEQGILKACFASDDTKSQNPEDYEIQFFRLDTIPHTSIEDLKIKIAQNGVNYVKFLALREQYHDSLTEEKQAALRSLVGESASYDQTDINNIVIFQPTQISI